MASETHINGDVEKYAETGQWLTMPFVRDGKVVQELREMDDSFEPLQLSNEPQTTEATASGKKRKRSEFSTDRDDTVPSYLSMPTTPSANGVDEETTSDNNDTDAGEFQAGTIFDNQESILDQEQCGPSRKIKKQAPMTAEQQNSAILQLKAVLNMHKADSSSRNFKTAPESLQNPESNPRKDSSSSSGSNTGLSDGIQKSKTSDKGNHKRSRPPKISATKPALVTKQKKDKSPKLPPEAIQTIGLLQKLGKPFDNDVSTVVSYASSVLDGQENSDGLIEELLNLEAEWKTDHAHKIQRMKALLYRGGIIPFGSVEAMEGTNAGLC